MNVATGTITLGAKGAGASGVGSVVKASDFGTGAGAGGGDALTGGGGTGIRTLGVIGCLG